MTRTSTLISTLSACAIIAIAGLTAPEAAAQSGARVVRAPVAAKKVPQRDTLILVSRRITVEFNDERLENIFEFIRQYTGAEIEPLWRNERQPVGLDREQTISLKVTNVSVLTLIERILEKAETDDPTGNTWQLTEHGELQAGPKERLNKFRRIQIYDINDLIMELPDYPEVPEIDLQSALQQSGGGGGQSPFQQNEEDDQRERLTQEQRANEIIDLILEIVEPEQWLEGGGTGGSIRHWRGTLIINAPDYMHRQINGYPYWPSSATRTSMVEGRRYVTLGVDTGISTLDGFGNEEVSAVVGGNIVRSGPGGGG